MVRTQVNTPKKKRWHQKRYQGRLRQGLCPTCGNKRTEGWIICITCREKSRVYRKTQPSGYSTKGNNKYRTKCRKEGICYGCGRYIGIGEYKRCVTCRKKDNEKNTKRYASLCLQEGICVQCKSTTNVGIYKKCPSCREKDRIRSALVYKRKDGENKC
ncbi:hypothetical protein LCGC14_0925780 [marine sediment metagenome]|uniref:Uncharacterized protein n=1 Tax=marine sediment metagenome TaxID=412755 RepID=A0A0F9RW31_9ZZZZ